MSEVATAEVLQSQVTRPKLTREQAIEFFAEIFHGENHIPGKVRSAKDGSCWILQTDSGFWECGTYDYDMMTRIVFLAHDRCIRVQLLRGSRGIQLTIDARSRPRPGDDMTDRHPTIEQALAKWREKHPAPVEPEHAISNGPELAEAIRCLRHMLGVGLETPRKQWGYRNYYDAEPGHHRYPHLLMLRNLGLVTEQRPGHWSATLAGAQVAGVAEQQMAELGLTTELAQS